MTCDRVREWIIDDLGGDLSHADRQALASHLESCETCAELERGFRQLWADLPAASAGSTAGLAALQAKVEAEFGAGPALPGGKAASATRRIAYRQVAAVVALVGLGLVAGMQLDDWLRRSGEGTPVASEQDTTAAAGADSTGTAQPTEELSRFVLLIYRAEGASASPDSLDAAVTTWARQQFRNGIVLDGAGVAAGGWVGPDPGAAAGMTLTHYLVIQALDMSQARQIALTVPTVALGGRVSILPIAQ